MPGSEIRTVGKHTLIYGIGTLIGKLASFIMLPVYTRYLTPADYGVLELLATTVDFIGMIAGIGLASGLFKHYAEVEAKRDKDLVVSTVAIATLGAAGVTAAAGMLLSPLLAGWVLKSPEYANYFRAFFLIYFLQSAGGIPYMLLRAQSRSTLFVTINVAKLVAMLSMNILFVVHLRMGVAGVLLGNILVTAVTASALTAYTFRNVGFRFSWEKFRALSRFGSPMVLWSVGSFILTFSDRYFLTHFSDASAVGVYSLAYKFGFLLTAVAVSPFTQVWDSRRFVVSKQGDAGDIYRRMFFYLNLALLGGAAVILLFVEDVLRSMVAPSFLAAYHVVPLILATTVLQQWTAYCNLGLFLRNATHLNAVSAGLAVATALSLNYLWIPRFGMYGAAWATIAAYAVRFAAVYYFAQRKYPIGYGWARVAALGGVLASAALVRWTVHPHSLAASVAFSFALLAACAVVTHEWLLTPAERASIRRLFRPVSTFVFRAT